MSSADGGLTRAQLATIDLVITLRGDDPRRPVDLERWPDHLTLSLAELRRCRASTR